MAKIICSICGWNAQEHPEMGRTGHLKHTHDLAPYDGIVKDYFLHPWEIDEETLNNEKEPTVNRVGKNGR